MSVIAGCHEADARLYPARRIGPGLTLIALIGLLTAGIAAAVVCSIVDRPVWRVHVNDPSLHSGLETALTLSALVSAVLLRAHFRRTRLLRDLLLLAGMATAGATSFVFDALPGYGYDTGAYGAGARYALMIAAAVTFVAVAFAPADRRVDIGARLVRCIVPTAVAWVALGELVDVIAGPVRVAGPTGALRQVSVLVALVSGASLVVGTYGFIVRHRFCAREAGLLAAAAGLLAVAQLRWLALTVVPANWITLGDALRGGTYLLLLIVSVRLYRRSGAEEARRAISAERQRIAWDLHDGLAQDLAFIAAHGERLAREHGSDHPLATAAQRALAAARGKIIDLEASTAPDTEAALRAVAAELAVRYRVQIRVRVAGGHQDDYSPQQRRELVRIAREAIANAIRHGGARRVTVTLGSSSDALLLRVSDDGRGFGAAGTEAGSGLGMQTMRERAGRLDGRLSVGRDELGRTEVGVTAR